MEQFFVILLGLPTAFGTLWVTVIMCIKVLQQPNRSAGFNPPLIITLQLPWSTADSELDKPSNDKKKSIDAGQSQVTKTTSAKRYELGDFEKTGESEWTRTVTRRPD